MDKIIFGILAASVTVISYFPYLRDVFKGKTKPHAYTWLIWSITQSIAVFGILSGQGGSPATYGLVIGAALCFVVFILSLKYGTKDITLFDSVILTVALISIFVWIKLNNLTLAVIIISVIDFLGYVPSFRKSYKDPYSETVLAWLGFIMSGIFGILALNEYNLLTLTYVLTITLANIILVLICLLRRKSFVKQNP